MKLLWVALACLIVSTYAKTVVTDEKLLMLNVTSANDIVGNLPEDEALLIQLYGKHPIPRRNVFSHRSG